MGYNLFFFLTLIQQIDKHYRLFFLLNSLLKNIPDTGGRTSGKYSLLLD